MKPLIELLKRYNEISSDKEEVISWKDSYGDGDSGDMAGDGWGSSSPFGSGHGEMDGGGSGSGRNGSSDGGGFGDGGAGYPGFKKDHRWNE